MSKQHQSTKLRKCRVCDNDFTEPRYASVCGECQKSFHPEPAQAQVTDAEVEAACVAAYSACDMGSFPAMAVAPDSDRRFIRAALEAAARARGTGEERG